MNLKTLWKIQYGMYIVSSKKNNGELNGQIANTVFQITAEPPTMGISINKENYTHEFIDESGVFTISILSETAPMTLMGRFGFKCGRDIDKFEETEYKIGQTDAPIITEHTLGYIECEVINKVDNGTHTIFIGKVVDSDDIENDGKPMTYSYYHIVKNGKVPKTATHYIDEKELEKDKNNSSKTEDKMDKYECDVCGYVYDPEQGDPDSGIEPGTKFEDLPDDWVCPVCGVGKDQFSKQ